MIASDPLIGKTIGNYIIRHKLGEGGMGVVYFADHPSIGKRVAIKVLHAAFASQPEIVSRFFNEAKAVNDIQHPSIVDIIDFGVIPPPAPTDPPLVYFIMEYIEGASLTDLIRREAPLHPGRATKIALQIADALSASHGKGIVHRDLKPDNVMLVSRGREHDLVKLLDFGIAKLTRNAVSTHRTRTGMVIGTPQYMSPEQCEGRGDIDHRTDVYALGIVLYQMLTGRVPFVGEGFGEVLVQQMATPPLAPSVRTPEIPGHVELVVLKALEKRPDHRYQRMDDMMLALQDPTHYVETHGGRTAFLTSPVLRDPTLAGSKAAMTMFACASGPAAPTTLSGSAASLAGKIPAKRRTSIGLGLGIGLGLAVGGTVVGAALRDGTSEDDHLAAPHLPIEPKPGPTPAIKPEPTPVPSTLPPPPPSTTTPITEPQQAKTVRVTVDSTPVGAVVFIDGEDRGATPCLVDLRRRDTLIEIKLMLPGYVPMTKKISPTDDLVLSFSLERSLRSSPQLGSPRASKPGRDDPRNPFGQIDKKGQP